MPTVSVDTFFACSLMIIAVLSAMAATSKILNPYVQNYESPNLEKKYREVSKHLLLYAGEPTSWGRDSQTEPGSFGLAEEGYEFPYKLDVDKVSRLNSENVFAIDYFDVQEALGLPDTSLELEIKPIFDVSVSLTRTFAGALDTTYEFQVITKKDGALVPAYLKCYLIANNDSDSIEPSFSTGSLFVNVTISNGLSGPGLLVVFARHASNSSAVSFGTCQFEHGSSALFPNGTFLRLSPLNRTLNVSVIHPGTDLSNVYALTFDYNSTLAQTQSSNESAEYLIPRFIGSSPIVIVSTGWNSTAPFAEWVSYPQVRLRFGASLSGSHSLSNVYVYTYTVILDSVSYECTIWLGGPVQ